MEEKERDPALNTVNVCYMNLVFLFGIKIGLTVFSIDLYFSLEGEALNRN